MTARKPFDVDAAIREGRDCIGVPFLHQGRNPLVGLDCSGLTLRMLEAGGWTPLHPEITLRTDYRRVGSWREIAASIGKETYQIEMDWVKPMDILIFKWEGHDYPQHFAPVTMVAERIRIIHTHHVLGTVAEHDVDESLMNLVYGAARFHGRFDFDPDIEREADGKAILRRFAKPARAEVEVYEG